MMARIAVGLVNGQVLTISGSKTVEVRPAGGRPGGKMQARHLPERYRRERLDWFVVPQVLEIETEAEHEWEHGSVEEIVFNTTVCTANIAWIGREQE